jgi:predicted  nucleic acid-binding Zn-ribbon protein
MSIESESLIEEQLKGGHRRLDRLEESMKELTELIIQHNTLKNRVENNEEAIKEHEASLSLALKEIRELKAQPQLQKAAMVDHVLKWILAAGGIIFTGYLVTLLQKLVS